MPEQQRHIIHTQEWELQVPNQEGAREVHAYFGQLSRQRLLALLDQYLSRQAEPDEHLQIDTLELDLGHLSTALSEAVIWKALEDALKQQFPARPNRSREAPPPTSGSALDMEQPPVLSALEAAEQAIAYFLQSGQLPWWSQEADSHPVATYLEQLMEAKSPAYLINLLNTEQAQQRLVAALPAASYRSLLITLLPPSVRKQMLFALDDMLPGLINEHNKEVRLTRQRLYSALLGWAVDGQRSGGVAIQVALWKSIAQVLNLTPEALMDALCSIWARFPSSQQAKRQTEWDTFQQALQQLMTPSADDKPLSGKAPDEDLYSDKKDPPFRGADGKPLSGQASDEDPYSDKKDPPFRDEAQGDDTKRKLAETATPDKQEVHDTSSAKEQPPASDKPHSSEMDQESPEDRPSGRTVDDESANNKQTDDVKRRGNAGGELHENSGADKIKPENKASGKAKHEAKEANSADPTTSSGTAPSIPNKPAERTQMKPPSFSASEELIIQQAGLVLLGPFLPHFFKGLGLTEDGQWAEEMAPHRAVHLLHHLATGADFPPEYETALPKVLCGLAPGDLLMPTEALSEAEQQACLDLLTAAIGHAPILKNMSPDGLRGSFLIRNGLLSRRDRHWYVQVERQTYDIVLDHLPWSFGTIKLPWINDLISVEW